MDLWEALGFNVAKEVGQKKLQEVGKIVGQGAAKLSLQTEEAFFNLKYDLRDYYHQGLGIPRAISNAARLAVFGVGTLGVAKIGLNVLEKFISRRDCKTCSGWQALRCTMCRGTGKVQYKVGTKGGKKPTKKNLAAAIQHGRAEVVHYPASLDTELLFPNTVLPTKECPACDGSGVLKCTECNDIKMNYKLSMDRVLDVPWKSWEVLRKSEYPLEHILEGMDDPAVAAYWLIAKPELEGGFKFDEDVKQKIWWKYKEAMRYETIREIVGAREPGWEYMQKMLFSLNPRQASKDPVVVKNVPYYKARKKIEAEVMKLKVPPRPPNWGVSSLPLKETDWTEDELKDPKMQHEVKKLLMEQRQLAKDLLNTAWETKWRKQKYDEIVAKKVKAAEMAASMICEKQKEADEKRKQAEAEEKRKKQNRKWWKWWKWF